MNVPPAKHRAFISPLMGGRMVSNVGLRRLEEGVQKPVLTGRKSKRRFRTYRNGDAPDTVTKERCRE